MISDTYDSNNILNMTYNYLLSDYSWNYNYRNMLYVCNCESNPEKLAKYAITLHYPEVTQLILKLDFKTLYYKYPKTYDFLLHHANRMDDRSPTQFALDTITAWFPEDFFVRSSEYYIKTNNLPLSIRKSGVDVNREIANFMQNNGYHKYGKANNIDFIINQKIPIEFMTSRKDKHNGRIYFRQNKLERCLESGAYVLYASLSPNGNSEYVLISPEQLKKSIPESSVYHKTGGYSLDITGLIHKKFIPQNTMNDLLLLDKTI